MQNLEKSAYLVALESRKFYEEYFSNGGKTVAETLEKRNSVVRPRQLAGPTEDVCPRCGASYSEDICNCGLVPNLEYGISKEKLPRIEREEEEIERRIEIEDIKTNL